MLDRDLVGSNVGESARALNGRAILRPWETGPLATDWNRGAYRPSSPAVFVAEVAMLDSRVAEVTSIHAKGP